jgi:hypothetical protein
MSRGGARSSIARFERRRSGWRAFKFRLERSTFRCDEPTVNSQTVVS